MKRYVHLYVPMRIGWKGLTVGWQGWRPRRNWFAAVTTIGSTFKSIFAEYLALAAVFFDVAIQARFRSFLIAVAFRSSPSKPSKSGSPLMIPLRISFFWNQFGNGPGDTL
jgi:hypothetical protein